MRPKSESVRLGHRLIIEAAMPLTAVAPSTWPPRLWRIWAYGRTLCTIGDSIKSPIVNSAARRLLIEATFVL